MKTGVPNPAQSYAQTTGCAQPPARPPLIEGLASAGEIRVPRRGSFRLPKQVIACSGPGPSCSVKTFVSGTATASAARIVRLGGSSFVVEASSERKVRIALTRKARRLLKRRKAIPSKVRIVVSRAGQRAEQTIRVRLRAPKR